MWIHANSKIVGAESARVHTCSAVHISGSIQLDSQLTAYQGKEGNVLVREAQTAFHVASLVSFGELDETRLKFGTKSSSISQTAREWSSSIRRPVSKRQLHT